MPPVVECSHEVVGRVGNRTIGKTDVDVRWDLVLLPGKAEPDMHKKRYMKY